MRVFFCQLNCQDASSVCIEALPEGQTSVGWGRSKRCKAPRMVEIMGKDAKSFGDVFFSVNSAQIVGAKNGCFDVYGL